VTETGDEYDVLKMRKSEKNGATAEPGGSDATAGIVRVSATREGTIARKSARAGTVLTD
jgi:hypothetical protein